MPIDLASYAASESIAFEERVHLVPQACAILCFFTALVANSCSFIFGADSGAVDHNSDCPLEHSRSNHLKYEQRTLDLPCDIEVVIDLGSYSDFIEITCDTITCTYTQDRPHILFS